MNYKIKTRPKIPRNKYGYLGTTIVSGGSSSTTVNNSSTVIGGSAETADKLSKAVNIWGNSFDGSQNVTGNLVSSNKIQTSSTIEAKDGWIKEDLDVNGNATINGELSTSCLEVDGQSYFSDSVHIYNNSEIDANLEIGNDLNVIGDSVFNNEISVQGKSTLSEISSTTHTPKEDNKYTLGNASLRWKDLRSVNATFTNLTVEGRMHIFELEIDKVKAAGGTVILSAADFTVDFMEERDEDETQLNQTLYDAKDLRGGKHLSVHIDEDDATITLDSSYMNSAVLYQKRSDGSEIKENKCEVGDLMRMQTFKDGKYRYFWGIVNDAGTTTKGGIDYNYIELIGDVGYGLDKCYCGDLIFFEGDELVQIGNILDGKYIGQHNVYTGRGNAIIISAYQNIDTSVVSPSIVQYVQINDFRLYPYKTNVISAGGNTFQGNFHVSDGRTIEDYITDKASQVAGGTPFISTGSDGFTANHWIVWDSENDRYKDSGIIAKGSNGDSVSISSTSVTYQIGNSGTSQPSGTWSTTVPTLQTGKYLWTRTIVNYTSGNSTTSYSVSYISKDGIDGQDGADGSNAVYYKLYPTSEIAVIDKNENLYLNLGYIIKQVEGNYIYSIDASRYGYYVRFKAQGDTSYTNLSYSSNPTYTNATYKTKVYTNKLTINYILVELYDYIYSEVVDSKMIPVTLQPSVSFDINTDLKTITSTITDSEKGLTATYNKATQALQTANGFSTRVTSVENSISGFSDRITDVEQTATGIVSTVSKLNTTGNRINLLPESNLTGRKNGIYYNGNQDCYISKKNSFRGMNVYKAYIPVLAYSSATPNKKYYGLQWGGGKRKSIKLETGKKYTLSIWCKANVTGSLCTMENCAVDSLFGERTGSSQSKGFTPTAEWKQYTWEFTPKGTYNEIFIYTYNSRSSTSNATTAQNVFFCMPLLTEDGILEYSLSPDDPDITQGNMLDNTNDFTKDGNLVAVNGTITAFELAPNSYNISSQKTDSYNDILYYKIDGGKIKPNTDYVLSFWTKSNTTGSSLVVYILNPNVSPNAQASYTEDSVGNTATYYSRLYLPQYSWMKTYIHFKTLDNLSNDVRILFRQEQGSNVYIAQPKLEIGADPTDWISSTNDFPTASSVSSKIEQKAGEITLSVQEDLKTTGIDITSGQIVLNADNTIINNNLSVGSLRTSGNNATITIDSGTMQVYGSSTTQPNIVFGVDENGYAVLRYFDKDGTLLYDLGPSGIFNTFGTVANKFMPAEKFLLVSSGNNLSNTRTSIDVGSGTNYYQFKEGYQWIAAQKIKKYNISGDSLPSETNDTYYTTNGLNSSTKLPSGSVMPNGVYIGGVQPKADTDSTDKRIVGGIYIYSGKILNSFYIYYKYQNSSWRITDSKYNIVTNQTYSNYLTLTGQAPR